MLGVVHNVFFSCESAVSRLRGIKFDECVKSCEQWPIGKISQSCDWSKSLPKNPIPQKKFKISFPSATYREKLLFLAGSRK